MLYDDFNKIQQALELLCTNPQMQTNLSTSQLMEIEEVQEMFDNIPYESMPISIIPAFGDAPKYGYAIRLGDIVYYQNRLATISNDGTYEVIFDYIYCTTLDKLLEVVDSANN